MRSSFSHPATRGSAWMMVRAALLLPVALSACYRYTPLATEPTAGREVRVDLSDAGSVRLAPLIGPRIESLDGRAMEVTDTSLVVAVAATIARNGRTVRWNSERLDVPRSAIARIRGRELDRKRSWLAAGVGVLSVIAVGEAFGLTGGLGGFLGLPGGTGRQ